VLVDFPRTVDRAKVTFDEAGVTERVTRIGQSFFDPLPVGADLYVLKSILTDWTDDDVVKILNRCAETLPSTGRVSIIGGVAPEDSRPTISIETVLLDGRTRPLGDYLSLATEAGLKI
jgi:hypothetical protein